LILVGYDEVEDLVGKTMVPAMSQVVKTKKGNLDFESLLAENINQPCHFVHHYDPRDPCIFKNPAHTDRIKNYARQLLTVGTANPVCLEILLKSED